MKKILFLLFAVVSMSFSTQQTFTIIHVLPNGKEISLDLPRNAAIAHLVNHPNDWCHPRGCP